jgi:hypothetical protein
MNFKQLLTTHNNTKAYIFLIFVALFMLGTNPFKSETIAPMDLLVKYAGWQNTGIDIPYINGERSDVLDAKLPIWISAKQDLYHGKLPIWNHQRAGKPGLTFTNSLLTPAFFTFALISDDALGFYFSNLVNVLIGLIGMYLFLRLFVGQLASSFGAIIFMFSGFNAAWFFWAHIDTAIWSPWILYAIYKYLHTQHSKHLPLVTISMLMLNLGGFPMVAIMTYMAASIMVLLHLFSSKSTWQKWVKLISNLILFGTISVLISVPFVYPLLELLEWMGGIGYRHGGAGFSTAAFELFINPDFYRYPRVETTFYVGILPVIFLFIATLASLFKPRFIGFFGLLLFLYAITIAFTLISPEIIHKIPTLNSSLLTRFGYLIGLALAIISAYTLQIIIEKVKYFKGIALIIIILFSIQILDQKHLFERFNGSVPNEAFYPKTKTLSYLQKNLKPFEHVMADNGYLIAGTLGGYGLNDWYAHSFHTAKEKEILRKIVKKPFKTPTSAMFTFAQINLQSPYIDYLGIRAILSTSFSTDQHILLWKNQGKQQPSPNLPVNKLEQRFHVDNNITVNGITLKMATYGQKNASSDVKLTLMQKGEILENVIVKKTDITDNTWVSFRFHNKRTLAVGDYSVRIVMLDTKNAKPLTIWTNVGERIYKLLVNGEEKKLSLNMALTQEKKLNNKYKVLNLEPHIYLIENHNVQEGAYFLPSLDIKYPTEYKNITTKMISNTEIEINYLGKDEGWVVLPMRKYPGWVASVKKKTVKIDTFLGMLPAIKMEGKGIIHFHYAPSYNNYTYILSLLGLLLLFISILKFRKKDTASNS